MAFNVLFVCYLGDETEDKPPLRKQISSEECPIVPRQGEAVSMQFGIDMIRATVIHVHHMLMDDAPHGIVVSMRASQ
jgi:hypothetical protein